MSRTKRVNHKMKPCLVQKASTSDEEFQTHDTVLTTQPPHGILKVPSGKNDR